MTYITVTANPSLNRLWKILSYDGDRGADTIFLKDVVGGSGIVVSRILSAYRQSTISTGILAGQVGKKIEQMLHNERLTTNMVWAEGNNRTSYVFLGPNDGDEIEYKEPGPLIKDQQIKDLLSVCESLIVNAESIFVSGSVPQETNSFLYANLVELANKYGVRCFVDAESDLLVNAIKQQPYLVKCNAAQASEFISKRIKDHLTAIEVLKLFIKLGAKSAMISLGVRGVVYTQCSWDYALVSKPPQITPVDTSGSGDCLLACFALALALNGNEENALRLGTAAGAVNALNVGAGVDLEPYFVKEMAEKVKITKIKY